MKKILAALILALAPASFALPEAAAELSFMPVHVFIDSGERHLAAYQFELLYDARAFSIAGLEGGEGSLREAPYYDPRGLESGRIVIASFTTDREAPAGRVRVATIHLAVEGDVHVEEDLDISLTAAADPGEALIEASIELVPGEAEHRIED